MAINFIDKYKKLAKLAIQALIYLICLTFGIVRVRYFIILPDENKTVKRIYLMNVPNLIYDKENNQYYRVVSVTSELVNKTMVYDWITVEK